MKYKRLASVAALIALGASPVAAAPLQPTSKWTVNFADAQCIAMRNYGTDAAPVMLVFKPSPIGEVMQVSVMQTGSDKDIGQYDGTMAIDGARATKISVLGYAASPKTSKRRMQSINLTMAEFAPLRTANMVRLKVGLKLDRTFALTGMAALGRTLDRCIVDLRQVWNLPAAAPPPNLPHETSGASPLPTTIFPRPEQPLASYFKSEDYPGVAIMSGGTGNVALMMLVDEKGKLAACSVIEASGLASLDWQSCAVIATKVTFKPALDPSGKPIKGGLIQRIRWMLPTR